MSKPIFYKAIRIALFTSILVNLPRILGVLAQTKETLIPVSAPDTALRLVFVFLFSLVVLGVHLRPMLQLNKPSIQFKNVAVTILVMIFFVIGFRITEKWVNDGTMTLFPRFTNYVYLLLLVCLTIMARAMVLEERRKITAFETERLKRKAILAELESLKNQTNPHFLFNALNSLTHLVKQDQNTAIMFIEQLSQTYRYILKAKDQHVVTLSEELEFLRHYLFLIQQRFGDKLQLSLDLPTSVHQHQLPVLALQPLVENAIKHNEVSKAFPLRIKIEMHKDTLWVSNPIKPKIGSSESFGIGLDNLNERFHLLLGENIEIVNEDGHFKVGLPLKPTII
ncbi:sensor histidine kinase [Sediminicola luteus]|nr:histidine kinase [Sediminicola luteus]